MKTNVLQTTLVLLCLTVLGLAGCQPSVSPDTNREPLKTSPSEEPVDSTAIETELLRIENDWPRVLKEKDAAAVDKVEAEDIVVVYPDGSVGNKTQDMDDMKNGVMTADTWEIVDAKVKVLDKDAAFVSGRSIVKNGKVKTPEGKTIDISGEYRWIDTFARRNGVWKLVASISTPVQPGAAAPATKSSPTPAAKTSPTPPAPKVSPSAAKASPTP